MPMISLYLAYGLTIASELPLPEIPRAADGAADVTIKRRAFGGLDAAFIEAGPYTRAVSGEAHLRYAGVGAFAVRGGREIVVEPEPGVDEATPRAFILGACLGLALHQRGILVLHASAVAVGGAACLFLGNSGDGKSSLCAALTARGHGLLTDDVAAIAFREDGLLLFPGPAQIKLWPDSADALGHDTAALARVCADEEKRALPHGTAVTEPVPLRRVYVLDRGDEGAIDPLRSSMAVIEAVRYGYCTLFTRYTGTEATHLRQCAALAAAVPAARLVRPWDLKALPDIAEMVEEDMANR
jgi:hypothetical protein